MTHPLISQKILRACPRSSQGSVARTLIVLNVCGYTAKGLRLGRQERAARKPRLPPPDGLKSAAQAAANLGCSIKTLNGHVASGALKYVALGHGKRRTRRMFTDVDLDNFIANQTREVTPCPSTAGRARRTGISTFTGEVIDFTGPRRLPTSGKPRK